MWSARLTVAVQCQHRDSPDRQRSAGQTLRSCQTLEDKRWEVDALERQGPAIGANYRARLAVSGLAMSKLGVWLRTVYHPSPQEPTGLVAIT
jgi:hypothetical protein